MKKSGNRLAGFFIFLAICSQAAAERTLSVVHSGNWPPYADTALPQQGLAIDIVTTALKRAGYTPRLETAPLAAILQDSGTATYDVFATPWYTAARDQLLQFSQPYLESSIRFLKRKDSSFEYQRFDDLEGPSIGVIANYAYDEDFNTSPLIDKVPADSLTSNIGKLVQGEIDLTLDDERVLRYTLNRSMPRYDAMLEILSPPLTRRGINIGVNRDNPDHEKIVADFDRAIAAMKQDGSYDAILQKHAVYIERRTSDR
jgi:polar amino acid transport system substrate-binding protein